MKSYLSRLFLILLGLTASMVSRAQDDVEYKWEIGAGAGLAGYLGDLNTKLTSNLQPMAAVVLRRDFNPYMGIRLNVAAGKLKGASTDVDDCLPGYATQGHASAGEYYEFSRTLVDVGAVYEYNFWPYGTGKEYRGAKPLTPFIFLGLGATYAGGGGESVFTANLPIGVGVKYKLSARTNLSVDLGMHFSLSDKLDGLVDPLQVKSQGAFKNTDCYSMLQVSLTYSFGPKCVTCHNDRE